MHMSRKHICNRSRSNHIWFLLHFYECANVKNERKRINGIHAQNKAEFFIIQEQLLSNNVYHMVLFTYPFE